MLEIINLYDQALSVSFRFFLEIYMLQTFLPIIFVIQLTKSVNKIRKGR